MSIKKKLLYRIINSKIIYKRNHLHIKWILFLLPQAQEALEAITQACSSNQGNLLQLSIDAARARCTVGEITDAMEKVQYLTIQIACIQNGKITFITEMDGLITLL